MFTSFEMIFVVVTAILTTFAITLKIWIIHDEKQKKQYAYYIMSIWGGVDINDILGPYDTEPTQDEIGLMHDDEKFAQCSLFTIKITKGAEIEL